MISDSEHLWTHSLKLLLESDHNLVAAILVNLVLSTAEYSKLTLKKYPNDFWYLSEKNKALKNCKWRSEREGKITLPQKTHQIISILFSSLLINVIPFHIALLSPNSWNNQLAQFLHLLQLNAEVTSALKKISCSLDLWKKC